MVWACPPEWVEVVREWVEGRSDTERVMEIDPDTVNHAENDHVHVYAVTKNHPAICAAIADGRLLGMCAHRKGRAK